MKVFATILLLFVINSTGLCKSGFVNEVYNTMYNTMSQGNVIKPELIISDDKQQIAEFNPNKNQLIIGQEFINLCRNFGKDSSNALAYVLGHELTHILIQQDGITSQIGTAFASKYYSEQLKRIKKTLRDSLYEYQADEYSIFYAHISGYNVAKVADQVLDSIYSHFNLKDKDLKRYPTLKERKNLVKKAVERMEILKELFDFANYAILTGNYTISQKALETILREKFTSSEIYNNLAVVHLHHAIKDIDTIRYPYSFPFEINFNTRIYTNERGFDDEYNEHLNAAKEYSKNSIEKNATNFQAWVNNSMASFLLDQKIDAYYALEKAKQLTDENNILTIDYLTSVYNHFYKISNSTKEIPQGWFQATIKYLTSIYTHFYKKSNSKEEISQIEQIPNIQKDNSTIEQIENIRIPNYNPTDLKLANSKLLYSNEYIFKKLNNTSFTIFELTSKSLGVTSTLIELKELPVISIQIFKNRSYLPYYNGSKIYIYKNYIFLFNNDILTKCIFFK
jgi:hypothetical protein